MTIIVAAPLDDKQEAQADQSAKKKGGRPTKAELLEECAELGIEADPSMTNPELAALIEAAKE